MKILKTKKIIFGMAFICVFLSACSTMDNADWTDMSASFAAWDRVGDANWRIENGEFIADSSSGVSHLVTKESFTDFQIQLEFWNHEGANSGVFMRISDPANITDRNAYEANIYDDRPDQSGRTGGIPNFLPPTRVIDTWDQWNTYDITMEGNHIVVKLNGVTTIDSTDDNFSSGPFSLQYGAGTIKFRNVKVRRL
tara:strand:- start:63 stop:650 length:588 start_codon:yes stop_codon:yes gene_type:complete